MQWWDKRDKIVNELLNCRIDNPSNLEIKQTYSDDFCLRDEDGIELTLEEAQCWFQKRRLNII